MVSQEFYDHLQVLRCLCPDDPTPCAMSSGKDWVTPIMLRMLRARDVSCKFIKDRAWHIVAGRYHTSHGLHEKCACKWCVGRGVPCRTAVERRQWMLSKLMPITSFLKLQKAGALLVSHQSRNLNIQHHVESNISQ